MRDDAPRIHPRDAPERRSWLAAHHDDPEPGVWVVGRRRASGREPIDYEDLVDVALAYGWIDGMRRAVDDERAELWFTRRRPGSQWTRLSKERVARVEAFDAFSPGVRRSILVGVVQAKRPRTRAARVAETAEKAGRGEAAHQQ